MDLIAMIKKHQAWLSFAIELEAIKTLEICFLDFKICHIPRVQNGIADSLARNARSLHRSLCFVGCSIPVWLPRSRQV